ncbi:FkbM family methyltransferase [Polymorphobacter multimanifer]|uniref:FkbM family methyltransferase n=1 Tax=Polymorphobacter multimanifer TaxID=1070431 RepID=A0A841L2J7_9SPHN|nr:FkbM family methyltransferase [Polymorphobacter multimanifer]MBB6226536.1 FkbM family methyltransferase [Polymorphobacter multimanifer]
MRSLAEGLSRDRVVTRRLPNDIKLLVSPDSQLKYLKRSFDVDLTDLARDHVDASMAVWDIGANCGVFAFSAAHARQVVAVEADPFLANLLLRSVALNGSKVEVVAAAVAEGTGIASLAIASRGRASNHLVGHGHSQTGGSRAHVTVPTISLDALLDAFGPPDLVKLDVEGLETAVLRGASRLLATARPTFYLELGPSVAADCTAILEAAGYRLSPAAEMNWLAVPG